MILKLGSKGEEVKKLQIKLGVDPVGNFGPKTEEAVKKWQKLNGLTPDGIVGDMTWKKLFSESITPKTILTEPVPTNVSGLKLEKLIGHIPQHVLNQIPSVVEKFGINTPLRLSHFLAQCGHESGGFKIVNENLNYSTKGLMSTFKKYFPNKILAEQYQRKPEAIASKVYGNRMGNGPESTKEGYKFRGRGYIQLTGKENYIAFGKSINEDLTKNPDKVATEYPLLSAAWFFTKNGLHKLSDLGSNDDVVEKITRRVNGGTNGLEDRIKHFNEYYSLLK
ncbi:MAG: glycoside hydrolase family 19 protein [Spirochaetes bacterium]|nr:MAG: glycoside hydrolase family 19 protein [Spirochaetota bacterium]